MADENDKLNINIGANASGVEQGTSRAQQAIKKVSREAKELDAAFRRLKAAVDPTFQATQKYNQLLADSKKLLSAGKISQQEYAQAIKAAKAALDQQVQAIQRNTAAGRAAAEEAKAKNAEARARAREQAEAERRAAREASDAKIAAAKQAAAAVEAAQQKERNAIKLSTQVARMAAAEARRLAAEAASPSTRGVKAGTLDPGGKSLKQLSRDSERAAAAAERASVRAMEAAARAAESTNSKIAASAKRAAEAAKASAEAAAERAIALARARASEEGRINQELAEQAKAARQAEKEAIKQAAQEAKKAAQQKRAALLEEKKASREAAAATEERARAEKRAAAAAVELRASVDPAFAAQTRYNETMRRATQLLMENRIAASEWTLIQRQAKAQMDVNVRSMGQMNSMYVQLGYQAQDVTASLASGISPLVILAQQGGQTAAALAGMGGTVGRVASFFAGPWGAAIIGFTLLLGLMIDKSKEAEEKTIDLSNAEARRAATLPQLTKSLEDFNKEQAQANINNQEALDIASRTAAGGVEETTKRVNDARKALNLLESQLSKVLVDSNPDEAGLILVLQNRIKATRQELIDAQKAYVISRQSQTAVEIRQAQAAADAQVDAREKINQAYDREETRLQNIYKEQVKLLRVGKDQLKIEQAKAQLEQGLVVAKKSRDLLLEDLAASKKKPKDKSKERFREAEEALRDYLEELEYLQAQAFEDFNLQLSLQDKKIQALKDFYGASSKETLRAMQEKVAIQRRFDQVVLRDQQQQISQQLELDRRAEEQRMALEQSRTGMRFDNADFNAQFQLPEQALQVKARLMDEEFQMLLAHQERMYQAELASLKARLQLANLPQAERNSINRSIEQATAEHNARMIQMTAEYARQVNQVNNQSASITAGRWRDVAQTLTQSMSSAFQGLWTYSTSFYQAMINMADQLVFKFFDMGMEILQNWLMSLVTKRAATAAATGAEVSTVAAGAAAQKSITAGTTAAAVAAQSVKTSAAIAGAAAQTGAAATAGMSEIGTSAAVAAAGAYKSTVVIPFIGPISAPAAAALALATVLGFGALISARGGQAEVPQDGQLSMLHKKEMVLPAWAAVPLREGLKARGSGAFMANVAQAGTAVRESVTTKAGDNNVNFNYQPKHTNMGASFDELLRQDGRTMRRWIREQVRNGGLSFR